LAVFAISHPLPAIGGAGVVVAALLTWMRRPPAKPAS
jgi:hypothetical protein